MDDIYAYIYRYRYLVLTCQISIFSYLTNVDVTMFVNGNFSVNTLVLIHWTKTLKIEWLSLSKYNPLYE